MSFRLKRERGKKKRRKTPTKREIEGKITQSFCIKGGPCERETFIKRYAEAPCLSFSQGRTTVQLSIPPERQVESCIFCPLYLTGKRRGSHTKRRGSQLIKNSLRGIGLQSSLSTTEAPSKDFWPDELIQLNLTGHSNHTCNSNTL